MDMLEQIFGSPTRQRLCRFFVEHPDIAYTGNDLARELGQSTRIIATAVRELTRAGVLSVDGSHVVLSGTFPLLPELTSLFFKTSVMFQSECIQSLKGLRGLGLLMLTGRFVMEPESPIDLLLVGSVNRGKLEGLMRRFEKQGVNINYTLLSRQAFQTRWSVTDKFLYGLFERKHEVLLDVWGLVSVQNE